MDQTVPHSSPSAPLSGGQAPLIKRAAEDRARLEGIIKRAFDLLKTGNMARPRLDEWGQFAHVERGGTRLTGPLDWGTACSVADDLNQAAIENARLVLMGSTPIRHPLPAPVAAFEAEQLRTRRAAIDSRLAALEPEETMP